MVLKELDQGLVDKANRNSVTGKRGDLSASEYHAHVKQILLWKISGEKKERILDELYKKWSEKLDYEARHIPKEVAGPARYNAKRMDKASQVLKTSISISNWFQDIEKQVLDEQKKENDKAIELLAKIKFCRKTDQSYNPAKDLEKLALCENKQFMKWYKRLYPKYKWRKNSTIVKLYEQSIKGQIKEIKKEIFYEDINFTAYVKGERAYIKFLICPKRQLMIALKNRGWWWNSHERAWSTYLHKLDETWVSTISVRYAQYI